MKVIQGKNYYSLMDLKRESGLSYMTVWRWSKEGFIKFVKYGGRQYIAQDEFNRLLTPQ